MTDPGFRSLRHFVEQLRRDRDLVLVEAPVDPFLEVAEIHRRVVAAEGPALLFTQVRGSPFPLASNLFGSRRRAAAAFGARPSQFVREAVKLVENAFPPTIGKLWGARHLGRQLLRLGARPVSKGPVVEVIEREPRLDRLPILTCWPEDGGPFVTLATIYTEHPDGRGHNLGLYRLQRHSPSTTGMHWQIGKGGGFHHAVAESRGERLPVTAFLGGPPALVLAAIAPLPENVPELILASLIAGTKLSLCPGPGSHPLISTAEFALTGYVPPGLRHPEGPFGDHYGYYSLQHDYPVFRVEAVARRKDAIYPATVVGKPRQEDFYIGDLLQELLAPLFPLVMPAVEALWSYGETGYHSLAAAIVKQRYSREAMVSAFRILGEGQLALTKFLLLTDRAVDLRDFKVTLQHVLRRTRAETDLYVFSNLSMDTLDYTGPEVNQGSKGVWLGLGEPVRDLPSEFKGTVPAGVDEVFPFCPGCLVVGGPSYGQEPAAPDRIVQDAAFQEWPLIVLSDEPRRAVASSMNFLWTTFTRFEPAADIYSAARRIIRNHVSYTAPILIDARLKPWYPGELHSSEEISLQVTRRWREYFPEKVEMGDSESGHLERV